MPISLIDLLNRIPREVEGRVKKVRNISRPFLQEALRSESRLVMRTAEETEANLPGARVPMEVTPGYPAILTDVIFPDDLEFVLLLSRYKNFLEQVISCNDGLLRLSEELSRHPITQTGLIKINAKHLQSTSDWAKALLYLLEINDPIKSILAVREDFLGAYIYNCKEYSVHEPEDFFVNKAKIHIYWGVVGLVSEWMGCTVEDLSIVVLTHELAHAYTQLGADIEGKRWPAWDFGDAEPGLKEGLAQYYTDRVLNRLKNRYPGALKVYETMLLAQPKEYTTHLPWVKEFSPESVRHAMLEVRRWKKGRLDDFTGRLKEAEKKLHPKASSN